MSRCNSALLVCVLALAGCADAEEDLAGPEHLQQTGVTDACSTGLSWTGGMEGSPHMLPGANCLNCHQGGVRPNFQVAGTVHGALADQDGCAGVAGVAVELTDAAGQVFQFETNAAGNFYGDVEGISLPYRARLTYEGRVREMNFEVLELGCNRCHGQTGVDGAPGRILVP